jgi:hypothetical protein
VFPDFPNFMPLDLHLTYYDSGLLIWRRCIEKMSNKIIASICYDQELKELLEDRQVQ